MSLENKNARTGDAGVSKAISSKEPALNSQRKSQKQASWRDVPTLGKLQAADVTEAMIEAADDAAAAWSKAAQRLRSVMVAAGGGGDDDLEIPGFLRREVSP